MAEAAVAEQVWVQEEQYEEPAMPMVLVLPELASDELVRRRAARFIGAVAVAEAIEAAPETDVPAYSLLDALYEAGTDSETARKLIETNVRTDVVERTIKSGHITAVTLDVDTQGRIWQHGQTAESIQANSLRFGSDHWQMRRRTEAETHNMFRINEAYHSGLLEDYAFVVFSRAADDMDEGLMQETGFFTDTMSCAIQVTSCEDGTITTASAFVAGKTSVRAERHDAQTIAAVGQVLGVDLSGSATETLATPLLIRKSLMPNGVTDIVELYDTCAGGTFFGEDKPRQDYVRYRQACQAREAAFEPKVQLITDELIARAKEVSTPVQATELLNEVSAKHMIDQAITDETIDAGVFGEAAAWHIEQGRYQYEMGQYEKVQELSAAAMRVQTSSSCPGGGRSSTAPGAEGAGDTGTKDGKPEDCEFVSKKCPVCGEKNARTKVRGGVYHHVGKGCKG